MAVCYFLECTSLPLRHNASSGFFFHNMLLDLLLLQFFICLCFCSFVVVVDLLSLMFSEAMNEVGV